jgi:lipoyl-dependent peroxiredoxin subunit D
MNIERLLESLPSYAKDLKLNLSSLLRQTELNEQQLWGTLLASAIASRNQAVAAAVTEDAVAHLSPEAAEAARTVAAIMGMNNVYYRFLHLTSNQKYATIPARLRMNGLRTHGIDQKDVELWATAVSAINGCGACVESHQNKLVSEGVTEETILAAVRLASVVSAIAAVVTTEVTVAQTA